MQNMGLESLLHGIVDRGLLRKNSHSHAHNERSVHAHGVQQHSAAVTGKGPTVAAARVSGIIQARCFVYDVH